MSSIRKLSKDTSAGIEGLPLQLMIMVVVAGVGTALLLGWMGGLSAPTGIDAVYSNPTEIVLTDSDHDGIYTRSGFSITVSVLDTNGDAVKGATVVLDGANIVTAQGRTVHGITDDSGKVTFIGLSATQAGRTIGFITATVTKSGLGTDSSLTIPVVSE
jgi:hypothetical protein